MKFRLVPGAKPKSLTVIEIIRIFSNLSRLTTVLRIRYDADPDFCAILHFVGNLDKELAAIDQLLSDEKLLK
jgi:hypothetical protein